MSNLPAVQSAQPQQKSLTGGFELQTKIRVIIQEVLAATVRKLSHFGDKIDKFEQYFITFRERFETAERERGRQQEEMSKIEEVQMMIRRDMNFNDIKYNEEKERNSILAKEHRDEYCELEKLVRGLVRQNENINSELSKTKSKFLEYSNTISTLKEEVSWKITKYLQETAQSHTQMKVFAQKIKNEYFNINLMVQKQKEKYDQIILKYEQDISFKEETNNRLNEAKNDIGIRQQEIKSLHSKVDDVQFSVLSKLKTLEGKFQSKITQMEKNNSKLANVFKKIDSFNQILDNVKEQVEQTSKNLTKRIDQCLKRANDHTSEQIMKISKENLKLEKATEKKIVTVYEKIDKLEDFFLQKIEFMKMEIESQMSSKTNKILQQKSKTEQNLNSSTMEQINSKISKMQLQSSKHIGKVEATIKENINDIKRSMQKLRDDLQTKIDQAGSSMGPREGGGSISSQKLHGISAQFTALKEELKSHGGRISNLQSGRQAIEKMNNELKKKFDDDFMQMEEKLNSKVEKVMFLVTKMRGDSIIRNEFNDKQIKEMKRNHIQMKERLQTTWKLLPGMGQCINCILSLIFDAEFQHSRIIQDNLPLLAKDTQKFNTCCEGVLYEFRQKKKPGSICYRHTQIKKTDLVKATFNAYINIWEQIYEGDLKNKQHLLPKGFYKRAVEKLLKQGGKSNTDVTIEKAASSTVTQMRSSGILPQNYRNTDNDVMNSSFHIRKKRTVPIREKEEQIDDRIRE